MCSFTDGPLNEPVSDSPLTDLILSLDSDQLDAVLSVLSPDDVLVLVDMLAEEMIYGIVSDVVDALL